MSPSLQDDLDDDRVKIPARAQGLDTTDEYGSGIQHLEEVWIVVDHPFSRRHLRASGNRESVVVLRVEALIPDLILTVTVDVKQLEHDRVLGAQRTAPGQPLVIHADPGAYMEFGQIADIAVDDLGYARFARGGL